MMAMSCQEYIGKIRITHERSPAHAPGRAILARRPVRTQCARAALATAPRRASLRPVMTVRLTPHSRQHDSLIRVVFGSQGHYP